MCYGYFFLFLFMIILFVHLGTSLVLDMSMEGNVNLHILAGVNLSCPFWVV